MINDRLADVARTGARSSDPDGDQLGHAGSLRNHHLSMPVILRPFFVVVVVVVV